MGRSDLREKIDKDLLKILRKGDRLKDIFFDLPHDLQEKLFKLAGIPLRNSSHRRAEKIRGNLPQLLRLMLNKDGPIINLLGLWFVSSDLRFQDIPEKDIPDWKKALLCLLMPGSSKPEANIHKAFVSVIIGEEQHLPKDNRWRLWLYSQQGQEIIKILREQLENTAPQVCQSIKKACEYQDDQTSPEDAWRTIRSSLKDASKRMDEWIEGWQKALRQLSRIASWMELKNPEGFPEEGQEGEIQCLDLFIDRLWLDNLAANLEKSAAETQQKPWRSRAELLFGLAECIDPAPPERDLKAMLQEKGVLETALASDEPQDLHAAAPVLEMIGRILLDGEAILGDLRLKLQEHITHRFFENLENGRVSLKQMATGGSPESQSPAVAGTAPTLSIDIPPTMVHNNSLHEDMDASPIQSGVLSGEGMSESELTALMEDSAGEDTLESTMSEDIEQGAAESSGSTLNDDQSIDQYTPLEENLSPAVSMVEQLVEETTSPSMEGLIQEPASRDDNISEVRSLQAPKREVPKGSMAIAHALRSQNAPDPVLNCELHGSLIRERKLDWEYWLAYSQGMASPIPVWLAELVELGIQYQPGFVKSSERLSYLFNEAASHMDDLSRDGHLLLAASTIRPSLMAPFIYPGFILLTLSEKLHYLKGFNEVSAILQDFSRRGTPISEQLLSGLKMFATWENEVRSLKAKTVKWIEDAPHRKIRYKGASLVWFSWTGAHGPLRSLIEKCMSTNFNPKDALEAIAFWEQEDRYDRLLKQTNSEVNKATILRPIEYGAKESLRRYVMEAVELAHEWIDLNNRKPREDSRALEYDRKILERLKSSCGLAVEVLEGLVGLENPPLLRAGAVSLKESMIEVMHGFHADTTRQRSNDPVIERENDLLLLPEVGVYKVPDSMPSEKLCEAVLRQLSKPLTPGEAFEKQRLEGHIHRAVTLRDLVLTEGESGSPMDLDDRIEASRREWGLKASARVNEMREAVESYYLNGSIMEQDYLRFSGEIELLDRQLASNPYEPDHVILRIDAMSRETRDLLCAHRKEIEASIEKVREKFNPTDVKSITAHMQKRLDEGFFNVAEEIIAQLSNIPPEELDLDEILGSRPTGHPYQEFMDKVGEIYNLKLDSAASLSRFMSETSSDYTFVVSQDQKDGIREALGWWGRFIDKGGSHPINNDKALEGIFYRILRWLGFQVESSSYLKRIRRDGGPNYWQHYRVNAHIESPIPLFGTQAVEHDFVLVWGRLEPDQLSTWLSTTSVDKGRPVTILYFGRIDGMLRRRFIHAVRENGYCPLIIDTCLFFWLSIRERRTESLFGAALAGGANNPYMPEIAGGLPSEMFFGRDRDIENLWRKEGTCIVYGGRQLGKSALLQQVVRRFHAPDKDQYVLCTGIKLTTHVWEDIRHLLENEHILPSRGVITMEKTKYAIKDMLEDNPARRILILLDESDYFLDNDSRDNFRQSALIRDLMNETGRRFKVVFTGLHSVQRFQRIPNQVTAHFGEPLCVGPLSPSAAMDLILKPLSMLGYRFNPPSLAHRILAHTNYHPCLIQFFCRDLIATMLESRRHYPDKTPPMDIDEQAIAHVYRSSNLSQNLRQRFDWTLDLDMRYRAIGYTFAWLEITGDIAVESIEGLKVRDVMRYVTDMCPHGFEDTSIDELEGLLQEMIGLGILTASHDKRFRLRSPNVVRLLGGESDILEQIERLHGQPFDPPSDPQVIRRILNTKQGSASPFVVKQESDIIAWKSGIDIVIASRALGSDRIFDALKILSNIRSGEPQFKKIPFHGHDTLVKIRDEYSKRGSSSEGLRIFLENTPAILQDVIEFMKDLDQWISKLRTEQRFVRVVSLIDPKELLWLHENRVMQEIESLEFVKIHRLQRWRQGGLKQWFHDIERSPHGEHTPTQWMKETGGWPMLVEPKQREFLKTGHRGEVPDLGQLPGLCGLDTHPDILTIYQVLFNYKEPLSFSELTSLIEDDGIAKERAVQIINYLFDLDLATGSFDRISYEPQVCSALEAVLNS